MSLRREMDDLRDAAMVLRQRATHGFRWLCRDCGYLTEMTDSRRAVPAGCSAFYPSDSDEALVFCPECEASR